jgi:hypothetical protein
LGIAFQAQVQASWGPWLKIATIVADLVIVGYALLSLVRIGWPGLRGWLRDRHVESDIEVDVVTVVSRVAEATNRNFTLSAGNVLNTVCDGKVCDAVTVNAWGAHLATLQGALLNLIADLKSGRLSATCGVPRLCELNPRLHWALRQCRRRGKTERARGFKAQLGGIADHANSLSAQLVQIRHKIQARRGETLSCYFEPVPKA